MACIAWTWPSRRRRLTTSMLAGRNFGYEHHRIPALVAGIPTVDGGAIPTVRPDDGFDVIWAFPLDAVSRRWALGQVPQQLLDATPTR